MVVVMNNIFCVSLQLLEFNKMYFSEHAKNGGDMQNDDRNEDYCPVCMDEGLLVCCDKCPRALHTYCHIPNL
jgi:hypothetical protein